jgi:nifR3 family TIM-barrel protein
MPAFYVRDIPVLDDAILSPMDGFSDLPFRAMCRELGSAMSYTEFVNTEALLRDRKRKSKAWKKLEYAPFERPMTFQIYGHDEDHIVETALMLQDLEPGSAPDIVDLNMGCYVRNIAERGAGSGMLCDPPKIGRIFARLAKAMRLPVTGKIRLGWDDHSRNYKQVAKILEDNGASLVAVHGRTKAQAYTGHADWDAIAEVKQAAKIPVIGNGDVKTVADIARMKAHTGCDGVMIGRAAIGNPWIFARKDREQVTLAEIAALMRRHLRLNLAFYGPQTGLILFRKHAARYITGIYGAHHFRVAILTCRDLAEFEDLIERALQPTPHPHLLPTN